MSAAELLSAARAAGLDLMPEGDMLRVVGPRPLPQHLLEELRAHKAELLAKLTTPGDRCRPLDIDHQLARLYGLAGSRREYLGAVALVAHFDGEPWPEHQALEDLRRWWGGDLSGLTAVQWIVSAAHADDVRARARDRGGR